MAWTSKRKMNQELRDRAWKRFDPEKFLTPSEKGLVEKRLIISILLDQGFSYRKIGEVLDVTRTTISFVKHNLKRSPCVSLEKGFRKLRKERWDEGLPLMSPAEHMRRMRRGKFL